MDTTVQHRSSAYTSIEDYLRGCVGIEVSDAALSTILIDRGISIGSDVTELDDRTKELCKADLYRYCAKIPSVTGSVEDAHGEWKHKEGGTEISATDKELLEQAADAIFSIYEPWKVRKKKKTRVNSYGMMICRRRK